MADVHLVKVDGSIRSKLVSPLAEIADVWVEPHIVDSFTTALVCLNTALSAEKPVDYVAQTAEVLAAHFELVKAVMLAVKNDPWVNEMAHQLNDKVCMPLGFGYHDQQRSKLILRITATN